MAGMTFRRVAAACCAAWALAAGTPVLAQGADSEAALRSAVAEAVWPGDIVRAAERFLQAYPASPAAAGIADERERALEAWRVVRMPDLRLYRTAFVPGSDGTASREDLRRAALGDRAAAVRLAQASRPADGAPGGERWVGWLQFAAALGDDEASYALALHYRRTGQPLLAARYESRALALGYRPAPSLDHVRK